LDALNNATLVNIALATVPVSDAAGTFTNPAPLPVKFVAVTMPAEKLPLASRFTIVLAVSALVAPLAATVPVATADAICPPTTATTVDPCVPVTPPDKNPEKLSAVVAVVALVAVAALPIKLPVNDPLN
jgi:hypothetical protein